jgi:hypothetical protein
VTSSFPRRFGATRKRSADFASALNRRQAETLEEQKNERDVYFDCHRFQQTLAQQEISECLDFSLNVKREIKMRRARA